MQLVSFQWQDRNRWGLLEGDRVRPCPQEPGWPASVLELIELGDEAQVVLSRLAAVGDTLPLAELRLLAPIPRPRKNVICLGLNYLAHANESLSAKGEAVAPPQHPVVFTKAVTAVNGPYSDIPLDSTVTSQLDWEVELAVIIGRGGRHIPEAEAMNHVFGYTVLNDVTARDLQQRHKQFFLGKSLDGCCPMGPALVTADEVGDAQKLTVRCWVNGVLKQEGNTADQLFSVARTIAILSRTMTLEPGDIIATGTPEGVGFARKPPEFLAVGDVLESEVEGLGRIRNRIVAA